MGVSAQTWPLHLLYAMKLFLRAFCALLLTAATARAVPVSLRVVDADNKPVAGANVEYADNTVEKPPAVATAQTAANGTLALDFHGLTGRPGEVEMRIGDRTVLGSARVRDARLGYGVTALFAGENTLMLQAGVRVSGLVKNAAGAPLAGARIQFVSAEKSDADFSNTSIQTGLPLIATTSDAAGRWEIADLPRGYGRFKVRASGFADDGKNFWIDKAETMAPELKLRAAGKVRGRVLDFEGRPLASIYVDLNDYGDAVQSDAQGCFELPSVPVGENTLNFSVSANNPPPPTWTGVSNKITAIIPAKGAVVDIGDVRADEGLLLTGTVVDDVTKAPVAGVKLKLDIWDTMLETDAQGRFEARVQKKFYGLKVQGDYNQKTVVDWSPDDAKKFDVGTIEVERIGATFAGRVTDANGVAVAGARVGWSRTDQFELVTTDGNGKFEIKNLPFKALPISASDGLRFTAATATPGVAIDLKLSPATALPDAEIEKMWEQLKIRRISDVGRYTEAVGARRVFEAARRFDDKTNPTQIGQGLDDYLSDRARSARTPAERADRAREGVELVRRFDAGTWSLGMGEIAMLAAQTDDEELRAFAAKWYDAQKSRVRLPDSPDKLEWYHSALTEQVMSVGAALGRPEAEKYRDIWLGQIDKPHSEYLRQYLPEWGETLWRANPQWFDEIVGSWPAPEQMQALVGALKAELNPAQAKLLLARLEKLASDPAVVAADAQADKSNSMGPISASVEALFQGRTNFARSMALVDAPAALDALDKVQAVIQSGETYEIAAIIAHAAIASGQSEIARRALNFGLLDRDAEGSGALALIARPFDADLSAQLMEIARKNSLGGHSPFEPAGWSDVAAYAFALRDFDAGAGRLLLEDQWSKRQQPNVKYSIPDEAYNHQRLVVSQEKLAWAMSIYDLPRALQWLGEIKDDRNESNNGLDRTRLEILVAALTPPQRRYLLPSVTYFQ